MSKRQKSTKLLQPAQSMAEPSTKTHEEATSKNADETKNKDLDAMMCSMTKAGK